MARSPSSPRARKRPGHSVPAQQRKHDRSLIPVGMATILPHTAQRVRHLEDVLLTTLGRWGYQEIIPPTFEYLDVLQTGLEPDLIEKCYKFSDRTTGRILLLRPDVTAQIARIVAMGMVGSQMPLRLCYRTTVFRYEPEHAGREREIFQVGAELIGTDTVAADAEMIALMGDCLQQLDLHDFKISLGHVGFFKALLAKSGLSVEGQKRAEQAAARKDLPRLEEILYEEHVTGSQARALLETPGLYGKEEVLARGRALAGRDPALRAALDRLTQVYALLSASDLKDRLLLDLGEFRGFEYYDGLVFEVFAKGLGYEIGGGGRYNHLIGRFGRDLPSTGFAFDVDRLFQTMERVDGEPVRSDVHCLICSTSDQQARAFEVARILRQSGFRVVLGHLAGTRPQALPLMLEEGKRLGVQMTVLVGRAGVPSDKVVIIAASPNVQQRTVTIKELPNLLRH
jgi:ATP phosphoribosyltransferase regulatory subunit